MKTCAQIQGIHLQSMPEHAINTETFITTCLILYKTNLAEEIKTSNLPLSEISQIILLTFLTSH